MDKTPSPESSVASSLRVPSHAFFRIASGEFQIMVAHDDGREELVFETSAYSGAPGHVNQPDDVALVGLGPIPTGDWHVGLPHGHPRLGPLCFRLRPCVNTDPHGRDEFYVHGDNSKLDRSASTGCIVLHRPGREAMQHYRVRHLSVFDQ